MFQHETTYRTADELGYVRDLAGRGHWPRLAAYHRLVAGGWRTYDGPGMAVDRSAVLAEMERLLELRTGPPMSAAALSEPEVPPRPPRHADGVEAPLAILHEIRDGAPPKRLDDS